MSPCQTSVAMTNKEPQGTDETEMDFGKYKETRMTYQQVYQHDPGYVQWCIDEMIKNPGRSGRELIRFATWAIENKGKYQQPLSCATMSPCQTSVSMTNREPQGVAEQMAALKSQVDQLEPLISSMSKRINNMSWVDSHGASDTSSSAGSTGSWTHVTGEPCCYLPDTYFKVKTADGEILSPAKMLFNGAQVVAANGRVVEVVQPPEQHRVDAVIELKADQSFLVVSPDHRILVPGNKTVQAKELEVGSEVILDGTQDWKSTPTMVLKISFRPDLPVAAFMRPPSILSKGSRKKQLRRGKKQGDGGDAVTIPDTEGYLTA